MNRFLVFLAAMLFSSLASASQLHVGVPIQLSTPTEGPLPIGASGARVATDGENFLVANAASVTLLNDRGEVIVSRALEGVIFNFLVYVGWDGQQYVVFTAAVGDLQTALRATRIARDGTIIDSRILSRELVGIPVVAFDGKNYAVAHGWVNVAYWNRELEYRGIDVQVALAGPFKFGRDIVSNGNGFTLVYDYAPGGLATADVRSAVLDDDGNILSTAVLPSNGMFDIRLCSNGRSVLLLEHAPNNFPTDALLLDDRGKPIAAPVRVNVGWGLVSAVAPAADGYFLVVTESQFTSVIAHVRDTIPLTFETLVTNQPYVGATDALAEVDRLLVLTTRLLTPGGKESLYGSFYALNGAPINQFTLSLRPITKVGATSPVIAWGDGQYLAAWGQTAWVEGEPIARLGARLVTAEGFPSGPPLVFQGVKPLNVAYGDGVFAVLAEGKEGIVLSRISDTGVLLDTEPVVLLPSTDLVMQPPSCGEKQFGWDGAAFRLLYGTCDTCNGYDGRDLYSLRIPITGPPEAPELMRKVTNHSNLSAFACADEQCMVAWLEVQDACGTEWHPTDSALRLWREFLDARPIVLSETDVRVRLAAGGGVYFALWNTDQMWLGRDHFSLEVYGGIVDRNGLLIGGGRNNHLLHLIDASARGLWNGHDFLVWTSNHDIAGWARQTSIVRYDTGLNALDHTPITAPVLSSFDSSRDGRSVGVTVTNGIEFPSTVYAVPVTETSRTRAVAR